MKNTKTKDLELCLSNLHKEVYEIIYTSNYYLGAKEPYKPHWAYSKEKNKFRKIEAPNEILCEYCLKPLTQILQKHFERPQYCMSGWRGTNNIQNAYIHTGKRFTVTLDIAHYFPNSKAEYVDDFWKNLSFQGEDLYRLNKLTTFEGHLPTGASTSNILAALIHKPLFDVIYKKMQKQGITFTTFVDDITLSSNKHIPNGVIKYISSVLKTHGLHLKASKIKRFGFKGARITGVLTTQSGKLKMPFKQGYMVIKMLKEKDIENMNETELMKLIGKIGYIQQVNPNGTIKSKTEINNSGKMLLSADIKNYSSPYFYATRKKALKQLKQLRERHKNEEK